jgi:hypothetical protein
MKAQVDPILDYTWTIEKIVTENETITADLNPFGEFDKFTLTDGFVLENMTFYYFLFGNCESDLSFDDDLNFYYYLSGCTLSEDSSEIATFFNEVFVLENTDLLDIDNESLPDPYGPLTYDFRIEGEIIYLDITNSLGDVATFWASTLSSESFEANKFSIFPNPVNNNLNIQSENRDIQIIEIYNLNGKLVLQHKYNLNEAIDVSSLAKGLYLLKVQTEAGSITKKLVKK